MQRSLLGTVCLVSLLISHPSLAQRQTAVGSGMIPLSATGSLNGVDMSASATTGTLVVGVPGGPATDILSSNNPYVAGQIAVSTAASSQGNIVFNSGSTVFGAIGVTQPGGPFLLNISGGNPGATVNFLGPLFSTTLNVTGTGTVNLNNGGNNVAASNFAADGTINLSANSTLIGAMTTTAGAQTGTLGLGSGSVLNGAVGGAVGLRSINVNGGSNNGGIAATITGATNAYSFSLGTNTLNVGGALTIANGGPNGVINTTLASPSIYGRIIPTGASNLGPTVRVNVLVPASASIPVGSKFDIVQATSGTNGSVVTVSVQDPTNPLYKFSAEPLAGTTAGSISIRTTSTPLLAIMQPVPPAQPVAMQPVPPAQPVAMQPVPPAQPVAMQPVPPAQPVAMQPVPPAQPVAPTPIVTPPVVVRPQPILPQVVASVAPILIAATAVGTSPPLGAPSVLPPTSDLVSTVLPAINSLTDIPSVINAVAQLAPSNTDQIAPLVNLQLSRQFQNLWQSHLDESNCEQISLHGKDQPAGESSVCREKDQHTNWWLKGFGSASSQGSQQNLAGYNASTFGTMVGIDTPVAIGTRVGLGIGFAHSNIDGKASTMPANHTSFNNVTATVYAGHESGNWYVNGDASIGLNEYSGQRNISIASLSRTAKSGETGQSYTAFVTTGYHIETGFLTITPLASLQYTHVSTAGFAEKGAQDLNLKVSASDYNFLESALGVKLSRAFPLGTNTIVPEAHFKWLHELSNPTLKTTAALSAVANSSFTTAGFRPAPDTLNFGVSVNLLSCACTGRTWAVQASYDYDMRSDRYSSHQAMIKFVSHF